MRTRARRVCAVGRRESRAIAAEFVSVKRPKPARRARGQTNETRSLNDRSSSASGYDDVWRSFRALRGELGGARGARHPRLRARPSAVFKPQAVWRRSARTTSNNTHDVTTYIKSNSTSVHARDDVASSSPRRIATVTFALTIHVNVNFDETVDVKVDAVAASGFARGRATEARQRPPWPSPRTSAQYGIFSRISLLSIALLPV